MDFHEELLVAESAAREAGEVIARLYEGNYDVQEKSRGDPVTSADLEANEVIREHIDKRFPGDAWLSEEDADDRSRLGAHRVWIVDPLDGTREFIQGIPQFCVSIGFALNGEPALGVIYNPMTNELFTAAPGQGANVNGRRLWIDGGDEIERGRVLVSRSEPRGKYEALAKMFALEPMGSIAYRMASVALGRADATITFRRAKEWDVCGGTAILEQAGGLVVDGEGNKLVFNRADPFVRRLVGGRRRFVADIQRLLTGC